MIQPGGDAPMALGILWGLTGVTLCFVLLRLYTRVSVLQAYGIDDHFYNFAFALFVAYDIMLTISAHYGFGRNVSELDVVDIAPAILYEAIGSTILVTAIVVSKASLALFLLRLVDTRMHRIVILGPVVILFLFASTSLLVFWFSCTPVDFLWNRLIPGGACHIDPGPISTAAGAWSVVVDFWYALTPWAVLWKIQMPKREKLLINISMSLGVIAGACGIKRALELHNLASPNFTKDTVQLIIWHACELAVTMICIGVPVCRPLYKGWINQLSSRGDSKQGAYSKDLADSNSGFGLKTIGGTDYSVRVGNKTPDLNVASSSARGGKGASKDPTRSMGKAYGDDNSVDSILGPDERHGQGRNMDADGYSTEDGKGGTRSIWVKSEVVVKSTTRN
ncbi:hypothetical protein LZ31DRAFT_558360 [Colletotrichum somersetense]|nr:hypothetical protein LZ31DRAFT_558360 [Colletotrichum somersetense]